MNEKMVVSSDAVGSDDPSLCVPQVLGQQQGYVTTDASAKVIFLPCGCLCNLCLYATMATSCCAVGCTKKQAHYNKAFSHMPKHFVK